MVHIRTVETIFRWITLAVSVMLVSGAVLVQADNEAYLSDDLAPTSSLTPADVVRIQLEALRRNGDDDRGIAVAYRFASPNNKAQTGPLPRFASMIKNGPYSLMLRYSASDYDAPKVVGNVAQIRVTLFGADLALSYTFVLSKQPGESCQGCWMTDGVGVEPFVGKRT